MAQVGLTSAQPASDSSLRPLSQQLLVNQLPYDVREWFFFFFSLFPLPLSVHVCESFSEPFSHRRVQAHFLSRRDAASYANHPAVSAASSRPTSSPATAPSASFLSLSGLLMNVRTLLPYARLQLSGLETPSVFANVAPWLNPADISCLSSFPLLTHFSLCVTNSRL